MPSALDNLDTRNAMVTNFRVLSSEDTLRKAANEWRSSLQPEFPVVERGCFVGVLTSGRLATAIARAGPKERVSTVMDRDWPVVEDTDALTSVYAKLQEDGHASLPVVHAGRLVGIVTRQSMTNWMRAHRLRPESPTAYEMQSSHEPRTPANAQVHGRFDRATG